MKAMRVIVRLKQSLLSAVNFLEEYGFEPHISLAIAFALPQFVLWLFYPDTLISLLKTLFYIFPFILPVILLYKIKEEWDILRRVRFLNSQKKVLLEIKLPERIEKTPKAMETFFDAIYINPGESTFIDTKIRGSTRPWWSFEIVSFEGELHFYIWTWDKFKSLIKTQLLAQFPQVEIEEVEDYLSAFELDLKKHGLWGTDYRFTKKDAFPLKTYIDSGLDKFSKEDSDKIDPLTNVFEKMASFGKGEVMVLHIMAQVTRDKNWKKEVEAEIEKIYEERAEEYPSLQDPETTVKGMAQLRPHDWEAVNALKHSLAKNAYDVGIRAVYIAKKDKFDPKKIGLNLVHLYRSFSSGSHNYLLGVAHWVAGYDYPWQDFKNIIQNKKRCEILKALKLRSYFHSPYKFDPLVLTTEELASIYHFPYDNSRYGASFKSNTQKGLQAPNNLPV